MSIEILILAIIITAIVGFLIAWFVQNQKLNRQKSDFEVVQQEIIRRKKYF